MSVKSRDIECTEGGKTYTGTYKVFDNIMTVFYGTRPKQAQVNGLPLEWLARNLLRDLVRVSEVKE